MKWIGTLTNPEEQKAAYGNMIQYWCSLDTHASSTFVAALPDGELKNSLGVELSDALSSREPIASLSWALAYPGKKSDERLKSTVQSAAGKDYETTSGLISESKLPDPGKLQLLKTARAAWNETKVLQGKWSEIKPEPTSPP